LTPFVERRVPLVRMLLGDATDACWEGT
jgi:hypothetical protein